MMNNDHIVYNIRCLLIQIKAKVFILSKSNET